jgi:hypothetical protein
MKDKKCKVCKSSFTPLRSLQMVCSPACGYEYTKQLKSKEWKVKKAKLKKELMTVQELMKVAQVVFNKWIRKRDAGQLCISCQKPPKKENAGHYFSSGGHKNVTFNPDNCHLQCEYCNTFLHGNLLNYQVEIQKKIGADRLIALHEEAHKTKKFTREELHDIINKYKKLLK